LSKKLAAGLDFLVMDVKCGNGAFMNNLDDARALARRIVDVANGAGMPTSALITDKNQPLASSAGNALEVREAIEFLKTGRANPRLREIILTLSARMLLVSGLASDMPSAIEKLESALSSGRAAEIFQKMVHHLGGPPDILATYQSLLPIALIHLDVLSPEEGFITRMDTRDLGLAVVALGGGRTRVEDQINHSVGIVFHAALGSAIAKNQPLATIHAADRSSAEAVAQALLRHIHIGDTAPPTTPNVLETME
jgi:thymidine phosphorylase